MSSVRGQSARGRGRGSTTQAPTRSGSSRPRGRVFGNVSQRGGATATRGSFAQTSRASATRGFGTSSRGRPNGFAQPQPPTQPGASSVARTRGSWQDRWQTLTAARERERADAIRQGLIADPDKPRSLADAITPIGTCQEMCAEYERVQRVVQKDVWDEETDPKHSAFALTDNEPDEARMVKKFRRAAAGLEEQLPSDLRPPLILKHTCDYLFNSVIGSAESLARVHHFVWDRTRAIRNDFSIQQINKPEDLRIAIECYERIARFHIVSLHQLALPQRPYSKYDWQQEREQLDRTLLSLMQYYDDSHGRIELPNEAEFRAYCVIFQLQDPIPDLEDRVQTWPREILQHTKVQKALDVYMAACNVLDVQGPLKPRASHLIARQDWQRFWNVVASKEVSYLMACVAEIYFNLIRRIVLAALFRTSRATGSLTTPEWTIDVLCDLLAFDDDDQVFEYCEKFGFTFQEREDDGRPYLDLSSVKGRTLPEPAAGIPKQSKTGLVESKRFGRTIPAVINGLSVRQAQDAGLATEEDEGMVDAAEEQDALVNTAAFGQDNDEGIDEGESLFIPETQSEAQPLATLNNEATAISSATPSLVSGIGGGSTFGKPSNSGNPPRIFASGKPVQTSEQPTKLATGGVKFDFTNAFSAATAAAPPIKTTTTPSLFNFTSQTIANPSANAKQEEPKASVFPGPSMGNTTNVFSSMSASSVHPPPSLFQPVSGPPVSSTPSLFQSIAAPASGPTPSLFQPISAQTPDAPAVEQKNIAPEESASRATTLFPPQPANPHQPTFTFGPAAVAPVVTPSPHLEVKAPQPQVTHSPTPTSALNHHASLPPLSAGIRRPSSSNDNRPKKPSPLSNSVTAAEEAVAVEEGAEIEREVLASHDALIDDFESNVTRIAQEFFDAPVGGALDQYIRFHVSHTIAEVKGELDTERDNTEADRFRHRTLSLRYGRKWRSWFWQNRLAKSGRERRQRRQRRLQEQASVEAESVSAFDELNNSRAGSVVRGGIEPYNAEVDMGSFWSKPVATIEPQPHVGSKRPVSSHGNDGANGSRGLGHKRLKSTSHVDDRGRISKPSVTSQPHADLLKRSEFLDWTAEKEGGSVKNTTTSSYFRLKAAGINRIDNAIIPRGMKRGLSASTQASAQTSPPALRTTSLRSSHDHSATRALMPPPASTPSRVSHVNDDDEALLARLKAARENLNQSTAFYKSEVIRDDELRRSVNASQSSNEYESPSMAQARADARLRVLHASTASPEHNVPAYRLRESKFVPREHYDRAIDRAREMRASRSRDASRPESRNSPRRPDHVHFTVDSGVKEHENAQPRMPEYTPNINGLHGISASLDTQPNWPQQQPSTLGQSYTSQPPLSFSHHTTKLPDENPFLQAVTPDTYNVVDPQLASGAKYQELSFPDVKDQTIQPSQINQAFANSFGDSHGQGQNHFFSLSNNGSNLPQQNSYLASQPISLLSDDEGDETPENNAVPFQSNGVDDGTTALGELLDESTEDDDLGRSYGHANPYAALAREDDGDEVQPSHGHLNPYLALARDDDEEERQHWDDEGYDEDDECHGSRPSHGYNHDEESVDGDIDEDGTDDEDGDLDEDSSEVGDDEQDDGYGYRDDGVHHHGQKNLIWAQKGRPEPFPAPAKNPELQAIGNTAEEAIELDSD